MSAVLTVDLPCLPPVGPVKSDIIFVLPTKIAEKHGLDVVMVRERDPDTGGWRMRISYIERTEEPAP